MSSGLRNRALSVNTQDEGQKNRMKASLQNVDSLLREVSFNWNMTIHEGSNPLDIALPLLDNTSVGLGHRHDEFLKLKDRISNGLKSAVTENFQSFNESIGSYRSIVKSINSSQDVANDIKQDVLKTANYLKSDGHNSVTSLNENLKKYNDMIDILNAIEELKNLSTEIETEISAKHYAKAQILLQHVNKTAQDLQLWELPALSNLKESFQTQEEQLFEILVEELHNVLYSKNSFDSFESFKNPLLDKIGDYSNIERYLINSLDVDISESAKTSQTRVDDFVAYIMKSGADLQDDENELLKLTMLDETNPFNQILSILSIIHKLGKLQLAIKLLIQRLEPELSQLINRIVENTKLRHPKMIKALNASKIQTSTLHHYLEKKLSNDNYSAIVIQDIFWNFFQKLLFFKQCIKILVVVNQKFESKNPDVAHFVLENDSKVNKHAGQDNNIDLNKLWAIAQVEIKSLILTYVAFDDSNTKLSFKSNKETSALFEFHSVSFDKHRTTDIKSVLQELFPGFIDSTNINQNDSPYIEDNKSSKQSRIIPTSVLHMRNILEPFLLFIQGLSLLVPEFEDDALKFFNDFMTNEFLPLLQKGFLLIYTAEVEITSLELFEPMNLDFANYEIFDLAASLIETGKTKKIFKSFAAFKIVLNNICFILNTSLQFRKEFSTVIFHLITKFFNQVDELYQDMFNEMISHLEPDKEIKQAIHNATKKLTPQMIADTPINKTELKNSKIFFNFIVLKNSLKFILELFNNHLIKTVDLNKTDLNLTKIEKLRKNWSFFEIMNIKNDSYDDESTALSFDNVNQIILDDELKQNFGEIVGKFTKIYRYVDHITNTLDQVVEIV